MSSRLHRHVLGRSLEHPHALTHGSGSSLDHLNPRASSAPSTQHHLPDMRHPCATHASWLTSFSLSRSRPSFLLRAQASWLTPSVSFVLVLRFVHLLTCSCSRPQLHFFLIQSGVSISSTTPFCGSNTRTVPSCQPMFCLRFTSASCCKFAESHVAEHEGRCSAALLATGGTWGPPY